MGHEQIVQAQNEVRDEDGSNEAEIFPAALYCCFPISDCAGCVGRNCSPWAWGSPCALGIWKLNQSEVSRSIVTERVRSIAVWDSASYAAKIKGDLRASLSSSYVAQLS